MKKTDDREWVVVEVSRVTVFYPCAGLVVLSDIIDPESLFVIWTSSVKAMIISRDLSGVEPPATDFSELVCGLMNQSYAFFQEGVTIKAVFITKCQHGYLCSKILFESDGAPCEPEIQVSDAIILAIKADVPIFVAKNLMRTRKKLMEAVEKPVAATIFNIPVKSAGSKSEPEPESGKLKKLMQEAVKREDYEAAAKLRDQIRALCH